MSDDTKRIFRIAERRRFTILDTVATIGNPALSFRAQGILHYLLSKPDNWKARITDIMKHGVEGRDSVRAGVAELEATGHIRRRVVGGGVGDKALAGSEFLVYEFPVPADSQSTGSQSPENPTLLNTDGVNTEREIAPAANPTGGEQASSRTAEVARPSIHGALLAYFVARWERSHRPSRYAFTSRDGVALKTIRAHVKEDLPAAQKIVDRYLADDDKFVTGLRHPLHHLGNNLNRYTAPMQAVSLDAQLYADWERSQGGK